MKKTKTKSGKRSSAKGAQKAKTVKRAKRKSAPKNVDEYIAQAPEAARSALTEIRAAIRSVVPPESEEILSYRIPAFKHNKVLVWYAAFSDHCSLFPTAAVIEEFKNELKGFNTSKGTIHFSLGKPMPTALIKNILRARMGKVG